MRIIPAHWQGRRGTLKGPGIRRHSHGLGKCNDQVMLGGFVLIDFVNPKRAGLGYPKRHWRTLAFKIQGGANAARYERGGDRRPLFAQRRHPNLRPLGAHERCRRQQAMQTKQVLPPGCQRGPPVALIGRNARLVHLTHAPDPASQLLLPTQKFEHTAISHVQCRNSYVRWTVGEIRYS
jgi:hypothetical protein